MRRIALNGGFQTVLTDYSNTPIIYWNEVYYNLDEFNAIYNEFDELIYEGYDTILIGERRNVFMGYYYNPNTNTWQSEPFKPTVTNNPRGVENPVDNGNYEPTVTVLNGFIQRKNQTSNDSVNNPYLSPYTGKTTEDRIAWLKKSIKWYDIEIKSLSSQIQRDIAILKRFKDLDSKEQLIIQAGTAAIVGLIPKVIGGVLTGVNILFGAVNNSATNRLSTSLKIEKNTALLKKYIAEKKILETELEKLTGLSSDSGENSDSTLYWVIGGIIVFVIIVYFAIKRWQ